MRGRQGSCGRGDQGDQSPQQLEQPSEISVIDRDECPLPTMAGSTSRSIPNIAPQVAQHSQQMNESSPPSPEARHVEQPQEAFLMLGDVRYSHQEVRRQLALHGIVPGSRVADSQQNQLPRPVSSESPAEDHDLEPFPAYVDPFNMVIQLGDVGYYGLNTVFQLSS